MDCRLQHTNDDKHKTCCCLGDRPSQFGNEGAVRELHVYRDSREPVEGEILSAPRETGNLSDRFAPCVTRNGVTVGHLPLERTKLFYFSLTMAAK